MPTDLPPGERQLTVVGAGTMGAGIALAALLAGWEVRLCDASADALEKANSYLRMHLERKGARDALARATLTTDIGELAGGGLWLEAVPEDLELKKRIFRQLDERAAESALLATNTSTLPVTSLAAITSRPGQVVGMHFFNPAAVLPLVEVVRTAESSESAVGRAVAAAEDLGKTPVVVSDSPGFIVNRVARPFYGEALRLLGEGGAGEREIDAVVASAGFPMGPFELMDLIGLDVNLSAAKSVYEQMFHEPRFRPHPLQQQRVNAGRLGRKSGEGFYRYDEEGKPINKLDLSPFEPGGEGGLWFVGEHWDRAVRSRFERAGFSAVETATDAAAVVVLAARTEGLEAALTRVSRELPPDIPLFCQLDDVSWWQAAQWVENPRQLIGFDALFFAEAGAVCLVGDRGSEKIRDRAEGVMRAAGRHPLWIADRPGLVLARIVCALVNEAAFALEAGVAAAETIDRAMTLGVSYPRGPLAWGQDLGWGRVQAVMDHLQAEYREPRYRLAPVLRRWAGSSTEPAN